MASTSALGVVGQALLARLTSDTALQAELGGVTPRIVDEVPQAWQRTPATYVPYVEVETVSERSFNTLGGPSLLKWGSVATMRVRVVSQYRGDAEATRLIGLVKQRLDGQPLTVSGYGSVTTEFVTATMLKDALNGVTTRELVADFDVTVHQQA